jgi:2OG-Fe(II) oxygenase superfamily
VQVAVIVLANVFASFPCSAFVARRVVNAVKRTIAVNMDVKKTKRGWDEGVKLKTLVDSINPIGSFAATGTFLPPALNPGLAFEGFGAIGLPLHPLIAKALKDKADKAPFGRGPETLYDDAIRSAWQFDPNKVKITGGQWEEQMKQLVLEATFQLGISNENVEALGIVAPLYKVLLYEEGGHFKPHKDTEKEPNMFGSLIVQLPSKFTGGDIVVQHLGETKTFESSKECESTFRYTAFFTDCFHEIKTVTSGWRIALAYNLVTTKEGSTLPSVEQNSALQATLKQLRDDWVSSSIIPRLGYRLDHDYTQQRFGFDVLKGRDAVVVNTLRKALDGQGHRLFDLCLVMFSRYEKYSEYESEQMMKVKEVISEDGAKHPELPILYDNNSGWLVDFDCLTSDRQEEFRKENKRYGPEDSQITYSAFKKEFQANIRHHDAGNEGGGSTTWYESACVVIYPAAPCST